MSLKQMKEIADVIHRYMGDELAPLLKREREMQTQVRNLELEVSRLTGKVNMLELRDSQ